MFRFGVLFFYQTSYDGQNNINKFKLKNEQTPDKYYYILNTHKYLWLKIVM